MKKIPLHYFEGITSDFLIIDNGVINIETG